MEDAILALLAARAPTASICPSEAARRVSPTGWRDRMDDARAAAVRLRDRGLVVITRGGVVVDAVSGGPIRIARPG
jgi:hypothetical protein